MTRRLFALTPISGLFIAFIALFAPLSFATTAPTDASVDVAARGYDVVAFFTEDQAVRGDEDIALDHGGKRYFFASADNKAAFQAEPARYLPQYDGICAFGLANGVKKKGDPEAFAVVDDKLFFVVSRRMKERWQQDIQANIRKANENWASD